MEIGLIVNSGAGRGKAGRDATALTRALRAAGCVIDSRYTKASGDGVRLAADAARTCDVVVAVGGDGTVNEVARGLFESASGAQLAVAPFGSGNDFAKVLGMPARPDDVAAAILSAEPYRVDLGRVRVRNASEETEALFVNAVGIGFDALVASRSHASRKVRGVAGYLYVALRTLVKWDYPDLVVESDGVAVASGPMLLATVGNGTCSGGGFYLTPRAVPADGLLDLCVIGRPARAGLPRLATEILRGRHLANPVVTYRQLRTTTIRSREPLYVHVDGEVVTNNARHIGIQVVPSAIAVRAPAGPQGYGGTSAALS